MNHGTSPSLSRLRQGCAGTVLLALAVTGCGLAPNAHDTLAKQLTGGQAAGAGGDSLGGASGPAPTSPGVGSVEAGGGTALPGATGQSSTAPTQPGQVVPGRSTSGTSGGGGQTGTVAKPGSPAPAGSGPSGTACATTGGNSTGVTASALNIGIHAPITGTGTPIPNTSFQTGSQLFWKAPGHTVCGRRVIVDFQDDQFNPSHAKQVCESMSRQDFLVYGLAGTDQIQACATDASLRSSSTPYLSSGVTTRGLSDLSTYFALSLTYAQQGPMQVRAAEANGYARPKASTDGKQWAILTDKSANAADAKNAIEQSLSAKGISWKEFPVDQSGNYQAAAAQMGTQLALAGYQTVWTGVGPGYFVYASGSYYNQSPNSKVIWTGPGLTYSIATVAELACSGTHNAIDGHAYYLAPGPGLDRKTADFTAAGGRNDIEWGLWGLSASLYELLKKTGQGSLTRQNFLASTSGGTFPAAVNPPLSYKTSHFGGTAAWLQKITCRTTEPGEKAPGSWTTVGSSALSAS